MLQHLSVHNFAIADHLELQVESGLTVITGETGAGKSIMLDALCLLSGDRADAGLVKHGAEKADISATFDLSKLPDIEQQLIEEDLNDEGQYLVRRVITREGRSRAYINGRPTPISKLKQFGEQLMDIHSQHAHQSLMRPQTHIHIIDSFGRHQPLIQAVKSAFKDWKTLETKRKTLEEQVDEINDRKQLLSYQLEELDLLNLKEGEVSDIEQEHHRLSQAEALKQQSYQVIELSSGESGPASTSARDLIRQISHITDQIDDQHSTLHSARDLFSQAMINIEEAASEMQSYHDSLELNPETLQQLDQRLSDIHDLARKHRIPAEEIPKTHTEIAEQLNTLEQDFGSLDALKAQEQQAKLIYQEAAEQLTQARQTTARQLNQQVMEQLTQLGMKHCKFEASITGLDELKFSALGKDDIEFLISSNPGQPLQSLSKIASGGELSRISLAIQVVNASKSQIPTLIFDEVDVGIGGATAEVVGKLLKTIGQSGQVLSVTHQPQVAAQGDNHLRAEKQHTEHSTTTKMLALNKHGRIQEVARMMGGQQMTSATLELAEEMIKA
jgi:DNA repair protein RecN (Recombination protein N)